MWSSIAISVAALLCVVNAVKFQETCNEANAHVKAAENFNTSQLIIPINNQWYGLLRYDIGLQAESTCDRVEGQVASNGSLIFYQRGLIDGKTVSARTVANPIAGESGTYSVSLNAYDPSQNNTILKIVGGNQTTAEQWVMIWACFANKDGTPGSDQGLWVISPTQTYTVQEQIDVRRAFETNGLLVRNSTIVEYSSCDSLNLTAASQNW